MAPNKKTIQVTVSSAEMKERIRAIAQRENISESAVVSQMIDAGILARERESARNYGRE